MICATIITLLLVLWSTKVATYNIPTIPGGGSETNGDPLFLTPLIQAGQVAQARSSSRVHAESLGMALESYSGFLTVRPQDQANMFFWFFPALNNPTTAPVVLWINGGPGLTSLSGLFAEIGPYYVTYDGKVKQMDVTWISKFNVIFLDAPMGAGFSFAASSNSYSKNTEDIAKDVHEALRQFFLVFTEYRKLDFYAAGESYAGKYVVSLANVVRTSSPASPINLKGIIIVSGIYDPANVVQPADYLYQLGFIQKGTYATLSTGVQQFKTLAKAGQYVSASQVFATLSGISEEQAYRPSFFTTESGIVGSNNALRDTPLSKYETFVPFVNNTKSLRRALHVGDNTLFLEFSTKAVMTLVATGDFANTTRPQLEKVLDAGVVKVLFVTGNMDYLIVPTGADSAAEALQWKCHDEYVNKANRTIWRVNANDVDSAGYVKCACNFCHVLVRNAGHRLPGDEPVRALDIVDRFINNKPY